MIFVPAVVKLLAHQLELGVAYSYTLLAWFCRKYKVFSKFLLVGHISFYWKDREVEASLKWIACKSYPGVQFLLIRYGRTGVSPK